MSITIEPTVGRIVWYRAKDGAIRAAIVVGVNGTFNLNLFVFGYSSSDPVGGYVDSVTHADPEQELGCMPSWHWMPYQKQQAEKHANEVARADEPKGGAIVGGTIVGGSMAQSSQLVSGTTVDYTRSDALNMALRTPDAQHHTEVLAAAKVYEQYLRGDAPAQIETKTYADGTKATGPAPLPNTSPTDTSEAAIEQQIQAKGKTAPRVTPADIEANIASAHYFTASDGVLGSRPGIEGSRLHADTMNQNLHLLTFCVLTLRNGFTVTGESACASPENFDAEIGRNIARQNAVQKIWPLMGYALKQQLHDAAQ